VKELLDKLLSEALALGAEDADAILTRSKSIDANIYKGEMDEYSHAQVEGVGIRVFMDGRVGYAYSESLAMEGMAELAAAAVANASISDADEHASLYVGEAGQSGSVDFDAPMEDGKVLAAIKELYTALDESELVSDVMRCAAGVGASAVYYANSRGVYLSQGHSHYEVVAAPIVAKDDYKETGMDFYIAKNMDALDIGTLVEKSLIRGMRYYGAKPTQSRSCPVIIHHEAIVDLISTFSSIFSAQRALDGLSLLKGKEGETIAADIVTLMDSPYSPSYDYTSLFDGEGVPKAERAIIEKGVLNTLLYDVKTANRMGKAPTGNGHRSYAGVVSIGPNNLKLMPGEDTLDALAAKAENGVMIYEVSGLHAGANATSGDFSLLCKGREIVNGTLGTPFTQAVLSGNFYELLKNIRAVGNDSFTNPSAAASVTAPSVLVDGLTIAGS